LGFGLSIVDVVKDFLTFSWFIARKFFGPDFLVAKGVTGFEVFEIDEATSKGISIFISSKPFEEESLIFTFIFEIGGLATYLIAVVLSLGFLP